MLLRTAAPLVRPARARLEEQPPNPAPLIDCICCPFSIVLALNAPVFPFFACKARDRGLLRQIPGPGESGRSPKTTRSLPSRTKPERRQLLAPDFFLDTSRNSRLPSGGPRVWAAFPSEGTLLLNFIMTLGIPFCGLRRWGGSRPAGQRSVWVANAMRFGQDGGAKV